MHQFYDADHTPVQHKDTDSLLARAGRKEGIIDTLREEDASSWRPQQQQQLLKQQQQRQRDVAACLQRHQQEWNTYPCVPSFLLSNRLQQRMYTAILHIVEQKCSSAQWK